MTEIRRNESTIEAVADALVALYGLSFGGKEWGRYRISRKFLRELAGRSKLPRGLLEDLADMLFEQGYVFIDAESYFVVLEQRVFGNYRRVTGAAVSNVKPSPTKRSAGTQSAAGSSSLSGVQDGP